MLESSLAMLPFVGDDTDYTVPIIIGVAAVLIIAVAAILIFKSRKNKDR